MVNHKTRKNSKHSTTVHIYANTMKGLHHWYEHKYEKLGWMVLAKAKGYTYKIPEYKKSLQDLMKSIKHVHDEYQDPDRKHDLAVLLMNTQVLCDFVEKNL